VTGVSDPRATRRLIAGIFRRQRRATALGAVFWCVHQVCEALVPVAIGVVIDRAVATSDGAAMVISVLAVFALFIVLTMGWRTGFWFLSQGTYEESHLLRMAAVRRILTGAGIHTDRQTGELLSITSSDSLAAAELIQLGARAAAALVGLGVSAAILIRIDWSLGLGLMIGIPLLVLGLNALGPVVERRTSAQQQAAGLAAATAADLLAGLRPLRGFGGVPEGVRRYRATSRTSLGATLGALKANSGFLGASTFTTGLLVAVVAAFSGWLALQGRISIGELITIVGLAAFVSDPVLGLADCVFALAIARASAARVAEVIEAPARTEEGTEPARPGPLVLRDVVTPGIAGLNLEIRSGELLGVATPSIPAADALTELLAGERHPYSGTITVAGTDLGALEHRSLRGRLLVEPHAVHLFGNTIGEVLDTGDAVDPAAVGRAVAAAALGELGEDLQHELLDHGSNLSGGQRQRVALARALLADRPILVLRDPTTAVDAVTEHAIADGLAELRRCDGRTTVLITTSPPLLARCDRVVFVDDGRVLATGRHAELLARPEYAEAVLR
jgi:putative ABC transport system ATP-binding protein